MKVLVVLALAVVCCSAAKVTIQSHRPLFGSFFDGNDGEECENDIEGKCHPDHGTTQWSHRPKSVQGLSEATLTCSASSFDLSVTSPPEVTSIRFRVVEWEAGNPKIATGSYVNAVSDNKCATGWTAPAGIPEPEIETTTKPAGPGDDFDVPPTARPTSGPANIEDPFGHWQKRSVKFQRTRGISSFGLDHGECKQQVTVEEPDCNTGSPQGWTQKTPIVEVTEKIATDNPNIMILTTTYLEINCITLLVQADVMDVATTEPELPIAEVAQCQSCPSELSVMVTDDAAQKVAVTVKRGCVVGPTADTQLGWFVDSLTYNGAENSIVQNGEVTALGNNVEAELDAWTSDEYTLRSDTVVDSANDELRVEAKISYCLKDDTGDSSVQMCGGVRTCTSGEQRLLMIS